jgi:hypothetical protein
MLPARGPYKRFTTPGLRYPGSLKLIRRVWRGAGCGPVVVFCVDGDELLDSTPTTSFHDYNSYILFLFLIWFASNFIILIFS